jgi:hypothetical protein
VYAHSKRTAVKGWAKSVSVTAHTDNQENEVTNSNPWADDKMKILNRAVGLGVVSVYGLQEAWFIR